MLILASMCLVKLKLGHSTLNLKEERGIKKEENVPEWARVILGNSLEKISFYQDFLENHSIEM